MRGILIDPFEKALTEVELDNDFSAINRMIGADCFTLVHYSETEDIFVDDEGLFKDDQQFFMIPSYPQPLAGRGLLLGHDGPNTIGTDIDIEGLKEEIMFLGTLVRVDDTV